VSRPAVRRRKALALLSRVMRPLPCSEVARRLGVDFFALRAAVYHPWFSQAGGCVWITEAGWLERLARHPCTRGE
jgi:hypothetical protein